MLQNIFLKRLREKKSAEGEDFLTDLCFIKKYANFACETINRNRVYA